MQLKVKAEALGTPNNQFVKLIKIESEESIIVRLYDEETIKQVKWNDIIGFRKGSLSLLFKPIGVSYIK